MEISDTVLVAITVALAPTVAAIATLVVAIKTNRNVETVAKAADGMKDALVKATRGEALLEGHAEGVKDQKVKQAEK